jgi:hypothetical protein
MRSDALVAFIPLGAPLSLANLGAGIVANTNPLDLLGLGVGINPASANIIGNAALFGTDLGVGGKRPELNIGVGTAFAAAAGTLLKIALQAAPDLGVGGNFQPGTWQDVVSQDNIAIANLTAGAIPFRCPWIPDMPPSLRPRFMRLQFSPMSATALPSGSFTAGTIAFALVTTVRDDQANKFASKNYAVQ